MSISSVSASSITLIADPKVLRIPVHDNLEPLVDLAQQKTIAYGSSPEIPNNTDYTFMRKSLYEKLLQAHTKLPTGMHLCLYEGYRSLSLQKKIFEERYAQVKKGHPLWSHQQIFQETIKLVSPVVNLDGSENIPPHASGGAVDVYLINDKDQALDMGIHPKDWMQDKTGAISLTNSPIISAEAQKNRRIMSQALASVGLVNYPTEYWHWSYGDKYWAFTNKQPAALYGIIENKS